MKNRLVGSEMPSRDRTGKLTNRMRRRCQASAALAACIAGPLGLVSQPVGGALAAAVPRQFSAACNSLDQAIKIVTESDSAAESQSPDWVLIRANGWTAAVPDTDWTITASDAGADINSPNGQQDASLITWYSLDVPWTFKTLGAKFLGNFTHIDNLCHTAVASSASGKSEAMEIRGDFGGQQLQAVLILSMLTPTTETYVGESRYLYTPASQWTMSNVKTLALIIKRAIQVPQSLG